MVAIQQTCPPSRISIQAKGLVDSSWPFSIGRQLAQTVLPSLLAVMGHRWMWTLSASTAQARVDALRSASAHLRPAQPCPAARPNPQMSFGREDLLQTCTTKAATVSHDTVALALPVAC
jgi:hypothetical protein